MRSAIVGFTLGVCLLQTSSSLPAGYMLSGLGLAAMTVCLATRYARNAYLEAALLGVFGGLCGFLWAALLADARLQKELPKNAEGRDIAVLGTIDSLPHRFESGVRFNFAVEQVVSVDGTDAEAIAATAIPPRLALSWYVHDRSGKSEVADVEPGERWRLTVRLKRPHGNANPHGFDYEAWLLNHNVRATGYVRADHRSRLKNERLDAFVPSAGNLVERSCGWLRSRILSALPDKKYAGVIVALVIGDQRAIAQSDWEVFNRTGIGHLISISGLHITMIAGLFASIVFALWRRSFFTGAALPLLLPAQKAAAAAGALVALIYVALAGFGVPAQRTLIMLSVVAASAWLSRLPSVSHVLCVALFLVVMVDPWAVLWPGFWLSFGAVAIILYASVGRIERNCTGRNGVQRWRDTLAAATRTQYTVTIGLVPLTILLFGQFSLISPLANAAAIPLVSLLIAPMSLAGSVLPAPLSDWVLTLAHELISGLAGLLAWLSDMPAAVWSAPLPSAAMFAIALAGMLWLLAPAGWPLRWLGVVCFLPPLRPAKDAMWITAFDVGQGSAILVETAHHRLLYDTGPFYSPDSDGGNRVILPYLKARGIGALDAILVSHGDNDHAGGALSIIDAVEVGWTASSIEVASTFVSVAPKHRRCEAGQSWSWDGVDFLIMHPSPEHYANPKLKNNARSCVLKITAKGRSILLPGDIGSAEEAQLLRAGADRLRADVLLAPHHGSGTSSSPAFLDAVHPDVALFQVGYRNRFRHPKAEVFERYGGRGIERLRSDDSGAILLRFGDTLEVSEYRKENARYWYGR